MYPITSEVGDSKSVSALRKTAGLQLYTTVIGGPIRGSITSTSGRAFVVSAQYFAEINSDGSYTEHGTLLTQSGRVSIAENQTQIMVVDGQNGWIFTKDTNVWEQITDTDFPVCAYVTYQDGYFIVPELNTQKMWISALGDGLVWDALVFTSVESSSDNLSAVLSDNGNLWCFGNRTIEIYQNTGAAAFPFERIAGAIIQTGCEAPFTVQKFGGSIAWLGTDELGQGVVWVANGYRPVRISTSAIERKIASIGNFTTAYAFVYHDRGHQFYCLQINGLDTTLCFDSLTQQWHERSYKNPLSNARELHRAACHFFYNKKHYIGDRVNGNIYELSEEFYSDNGDEIVWERISPHIQNEKKLLRFSSFELDMEIGVGNQTGQGSDPQVMMRYSDDGCKTWSAEKWRSFGKIGEFFKLIIWRRQGTARERIFQWKITDPVPVRITGAYAEGRIGKA